MTTETATPELDESVQSVQSVHPDLEQLLALMHALGSEWSGSPQIQLRVWGLHLLEDWRTLKLYAERMR